jgi:hypothetical protein
MYNLSDLEQARAGTFGSVQGVSFYGSHVPKRS